MKEKVYFIRIDDNEEDRSICRKLEKIINNEDLFTFIKAKDLVAVKTHFGEEGTEGFVRPVYFSMMGEIIKRKGASPFLTDTSTLYKGRRSDAVAHIHMALDHGFTTENTGLPIVMSDGLFGDEEREVKIPGKIYDKVGIASLIVRSQSLIVVSHFTGHMLSGFGATLKNLGMGCSSRKGKLVQHSTAKPSIKVSKCTGCAECIKWCPQDAITIREEIAVIDKNLCIGCGECFAVCRFDAVTYNWSETYEKLQQKMVEHALGVMECKKGKVIFFNFLNRITKDCDCMKGYNKVIPDIGVLISYDPVAIDAAAIDLVEKECGHNWPQLSYNIPHRVQIEYASEIGFGNPDYELIDLTE